MQIAHIRQRLRELGARPEHEQRVLRDWLQVRPHDSGRRRPVDYLPLALRLALPSIDAELRGMARLVATHPVDDGSARLLVGLHDEQMVESVLLPRGGLCISSQVGCAVGCQFCMTGRSGLLRQLTSGEMLAQVALARTQRAVKKVVFMGMGEPAHNLDNVMDAIELLGTEGNLGHKNIVFSTVGDARAFERLPQGSVKPALAVSLHTTKADLRERLLPRAPKFTPEELVALADDYGRATAYPVQYQWTLLEDINDGEDEIDGIVKLFKGRYGVLNIISFNTIPDSAFTRPSEERAREMIRILHRRGVLAKLRDSAAQEVDGGCGQLRARAVMQTQRTVVRIQAG
ncbi:MAG: RNA methyltransferase [Proteobacteria bacterium]|nr:RNA methyltransferase [Pseudomonadota bacterium]